MPLPTHFHAWGATKKGAALERIEKPIPVLGEYEALVQNLACGVCHSDLHLIDDDWGMSNFPLVPGHEIFGKVVACGKNSFVKEGEFVGVGWQRSSCMQCENCLSANENLCDANQATCVGHWGGYADYHITDSRFAFKLPAGLQKPEAAPLLCGGATVYSPLTCFLNTSGFKPARVGIVGLGGLGHMAVKMARAMGAEVTVFSSSTNKVDMARQMGATDVVVSNNEDNIKDYGRKLDLVLVTANVDLPWNAYLSTLRVDGTLCFVGIPPSPVGIHAFELLSKRLRVSASPIGSREKIYQMLEFCDRFQILPETETYQMDEVNSVLGRVRENRVRYRAVLRT